MIIFLYGSDTYRSRQKLNEMIEHYKKIHKSGVSLKCFDAQSLDFQDFRNEIQQVTMFQEKKLIVLKNVFLNSRFKEEFLDFIKKNKNLKELILLYEEGSVTKSDRLVKFLKKQAKFQEFQPLRGEKLKDWVEKELEKRSIKIEPMAEEKLINYINNDLWRFSNEIKKLVSYKKNKKIETKDVALLVRPKAEADIFRTIDAIALRDKKRALYFIRKHLEKGDSILYVLSMINYQFRNLLIIKSFIENHASYGDILRKSKLHPYVVKKSYQQAQKFRLDELKKIYQKIFKTDFNIKTGKIEPEIALDILISEM